MIRCPQPVRVGSRAMQVVILVPLTGIRCHRWIIDLTRQRTSSLRIPTSHQTDTCRCLKVPFLFAQNRRFMTGLNIFALQKSVVANITELGNIAIKPMTILFVFITYWLVFKEILSNPLSCVCFAQYLYNIHVLHLRSKQKPFITNSTNPTIPRGYWPKFKGWMVAAIFRYQNIEAMIYGIFRY